MSSTTLRRINHFHLFCGLGGGARGFNRGRARVGNVEAVFRCLGGIDVDAAAIRDFQNLAGVPGTVLDLFSREQYVDFHGREPGADWREATALDVQAAAGFERPHIVFLSAPCKGFSGLLSEAASRSRKYQALNKLTLRGIWLMLEAWADDPVELIVFENVPRIAQRGRHLLDQIGALLRSYGYVVAETTHDCGELGALAQSRKRFLLMARHAVKVPPFLYEPEKRPLRGVGEVLSRLPVPGPETQLAMHRMPALQWNTWVRLAFVEAGKDWRSLNRLQVEDGYLQDFLLVSNPDWRASVLGVRQWNEPCGTVAGRSSPTNGAYSVADPRIDGHPRSVQLGVRTWEESTGVVTGQCLVGQGPYAVADPRIPKSSSRHHNLYRIVEWGRTSNCVTGAVRPAGGALSVADPRPAFTRNGRDKYLTAGHYGVVGWDETSGVVSSSAGHDAGRFSVADPRPAKGEALPSPDARLVAVIQALDGTWHRPFTTLELAALQGLVDPEEFLELDGLSDRAWRERIGNAVPPAAAEAIASVMGRTLLLAWAGESFMLSSDPIWVAPMALGLSVANQPTA